MHLCFPTIRPSNFQPKLEPITVRHSTNERSHFKQEWTEMDQNEQEWTENELQ